MTVHAQAYTIEEFERIAALPENRDRLLELVHGEIVEKMPTEEHGVIVVLFIAFLSPFVNEHGLGILTTEASHSSDEGNVRLPDVSFIAGERPLVTKGSIPRMPDLAIEVKSPDDTYRQMREKAEYYLQNGCKIVWLVYPEKRLVEVYQADADIQFLTAEDALNGGAVLPGFSLSLSKIFRV